MNAQPATIHIVDDDESFRRAVTRLLQAAGFAVQGYASAGEFLVARIGLGSGVYRVQPFVATVDGVTQAGLGLNVQQQLGTNSPFAWFGRFGVGGSRVTLDGAAAQVATGLAMQAPLQYAGLFPKLSSDYAGVGFIWSRPSVVMEPVAHRNEYGLEAMYMLQLTPLASLQTDVQFIWNPAGNAAAERNLVFQFQLNFPW